MKSKIKKEEEPIYVFKQVLNWKFILNPVIYVTALIMMIITSLATLIFAFIPILNIHYFDKLCLGLDKNDFKTSIYKTQKYKLTKQKNDKNYTLEKVN